MNHAWKVLPYFSGFKPQIFDSGGTVTPQGFVVGCYCAQRDDDKWFGVPVVFDYTKHKNKLEQMMAVGEECAKALNQLNKFLEQE